MPTNQVVLDALIPRQDFEAGSTNTLVGSFDRITASELEPNKATYSILRKPDFQRPTYDWSPEKVRDLVAAFVEEDLVPAIILWRSPSNDLFVIDGCHRLSSLIAWVQDDYGDGVVSKAFYKDDIPKSQKVIADKTRSLINDLVGPYRDIANAFANPHSSPQYIETAKKLASRALYVQWLVTGDAEKAERSFFKINQQGTAIDTTELRLLRARTRPNALAARAIIRRGTGHVYWKKFDADKRAEIEKLAQEINSCLFTPPLDTSTIKTMDIPIAGRLNSSLPLLFDMINISNKVEVPEEHKKPKDEAIEKSLPPEDKDGAATIQFLRNAKRIAQRISSVEPLSLGLHPAVYFYSDNGRHQPSSFLAIVTLIQEFELKDRFVKFTLHRRKFEDFLISHKDFSNQLLRQYRGAVKGVPKLKELFNKVLGYIEQGKEDKAIVTAIQKDFAFLKIPTIEATTSKKDFDSGAKSKAFLKNALANSPRCGLCTCLVHMNAMHIDHIEDKKHGGTGTPTNAQLAHPFCNSAKDAIWPPKAKG